MIIYCTVDGQCVMSSIEIIVKLKMIIIAMFDESSIIATHVLQHTTKATYYNENFKEPLFVDCRYIFAFRAVMTFLKQRNLESYKLSSQDLPL